MGDTARIGFIGCGTHATNNLYPQLKYSRCTLEAVCDLDRLLAERNAAMFGGKSVYTDARKMLNERRLDGVMIVGPSQVHYELGKQVLERGIALFTEKPPAPDLPRTRELVALARRQGVPFMVGFMKRHGMTYRKARQMIQAGEFDLQTGAFKYGHWAMKDLPSMLLGMSVHPIDLAISFFGDVAEVNSSTYEGPQALSLSVTLRFASGKIAHLFLDASQPRIQERVELSGILNGGNALIVIDNVHHMELHRQGRNGIDVLAPSMAEIHPDFDLADIQVWRPDYGIPNMGQTRAFFQGFTGEVREFVDAILEKRQPYPGTDDAPKAMAVIEAILARPNGIMSLHE